MDSCSIGVHVGKGEDCHNRCYARKSGLLKLTELPATERELLLQRTSFSKPDCSTTVCFHHEQVFFFEVLISTKDLL